METQELLDKIRGSEENRRKAIGFIMDHTEIRNKITTYVLHNSGTTEEATSIFHDSVIAFVKYVIQHRDFQLSSSLVGYMRTIGKYQWINRLRKVGKSAAEAGREIDELHIESSFKSDQFILSKEKSQALKTLLDRLAKRCREVLLLWSNGYSMKEIASLVDYQSEGMARKKKSQCMKSLYQMIEENPNIKEQLRN